MKLDYIAADINTIGRFCGPRDLKELTQECLFQTYGIRKADVIILFGGSIASGGDVAASAVHHGIATRLMISGGAGHTTDSLRQQFQPLIPGSDLCEAMEADIFTAYLRQQYQIIPDYIERTSTNCGNNVTNTLDILKNQRISPKHIILIQDAAMQRRMEAGFRKYLDDNTVMINYASYRTDVIVRDGRLAFEQDDIWGMWDMNRYITLLMGEIPRLADNADGYGPNGKNFIAHVELPDDVLIAFERLKEHYGGYIRSADLRFASK